MKSRIVVLSLAIAAVLSLSAFALPSNLTQEMVSLDRRYIPALGLTGQPDQFEKAKVAFSAFEKTWIAFRDGVAAQPGFDTEWKDNLETINKIVDKTKTALITNSDAPAAHEALEGVRMTLLAARSRQNIPYFVDYLTLYHNAMEDLLNNKPTALLKDWSASEKLSFNADLDLAIAHWNKVKSQEGLLLSEAALTPQALSTYMTQWQAVSGIMSGTKAALEAGNDKTLADQLGQLKPNFIKTFFLFGDFKL